MGGPSKLQVHQKQLETLLGIILELREAERDFNLLEILLSF